jgi:DUF4097 and DUF4098 domain-containing protein YvlB
MNRTIIGLVCFIIAASCCVAADDAAEKTITKSFAVQSGGAVSVDADQGDIEVLTGSHDQVEIVVERNVSGGSETQQAKVLKAHKVTFSQDGNNVHVEANTEKKPRSWFSTEPNLSVHFRITVPKRFDADLTTAGGNIKVSDLIGNVDARTSGGDLIFSKIQGRVSANTSGGNIRAENCTDNLAVQTSGGNIIIKNFTGPSAQADTSGGNIDASACSGKLQLKTSGGNVDIAEFSGPSVYADTSGGAVSLGMDQQPTGDSWLRTSGGSITARLPESVALNLSASTDGGTVSSSLPVAVEGKQKEGKLEGKINGGGPLLSLKTSGGDIQVLKK